MKRRTIYLVYVNKQKKVPFRITPRKYVVDEIKSNFPDNDFFIKKKLLTDGEIANLLISNPWSFNKDEFVK